MVRMGAGETLAALPVLLHGCGKEVAAELPLVSPSKRIASLRVMGVTGPVALSLSSSWSPI